MQLNSVDSATPNATIRGSSGRSAGRAGDQPSPISPPYADCILRILLVLNTQKHFYFPFRDPVASSRPYFERFCAEHLSAKTRGVALSPGPHTIANYPDVTQR
jgi:hypothetical protein